VVEFNMQDFKGARDQYVEDVRDRDSLASRVEELKIQKAGLEVKLQDADSARTIHQIVAQKTLANLEFHISALASTALCSVDPTWPEFVARVEIRRNQVEVDLLFKEFGVEQRPAESSGFGTMDVAGYALRPTLWSLDKTRECFIHDEPFRDVSPDRQYLVSQMIKMVADKLKLQLLMVSHADDINVAADRTFYVVKDGKYSLVEEEE
jgi:hypothetical protein